MDNILVSSRMAKPLGIAMGSWQIPFLLLMLSGLVAAFSMQYARARFSPEGSFDGARAMLSGTQFDEWQFKPYSLYGGLDIFVASVGQMQARVQHHDAMGARLDKLSGMKPEGFRFDPSPVQGGPLVTASMQEMAAGGLDRQLNRLVQLLRDRSEKLMALETQLMQNQLGRELLPPVSPVNENWRTTNFGWRVDPFTGTGAMHEGIDFMAPQGTSIRALAGGVVTYSDNHYQYGNMIEIDHGNDIVTRYAHASRLLVQVGQVVRRGERIAEVGSTGRSTGNHLHFEVRYKGIAQNPVRFLQNAAS